MGNWPNLYPIRSPGCEGGTVNATNARATLVAPSASANTKSAAFTEVFTATQYPIEALWIQIQKGTSDGPDYLVDLYMGAIGQEVLLVENLLFCAPGVSTDDYNGNQSYYFPVSLRAGTRLSAKVQASAGASSSVGIRIIAVRGTWYGQPQHQILTYGAVTGTSGGTNILDGTEASPPSWTDLTTNLARNCRGLVVAIGKRGVSSGVGRVFRAEVGVGSGHASIFSWYLQSPGTGSVDIHPQASMYYPIPLRAGETIAVRLFCDLLSGNDYDAVAYLVS